MAAVSKARVDACSVLTRLVHCGRETWPANWFHVVEQLSRAPPMFPTLTAVKVAENVFRRVHPGRVMGTESVNPDGNVVMVGPGGCGKSLVLEHCAKALVASDVSHLTVVVHVDCGVERGSEAPSIASHVWREVVSKKKEKRVLYTGQGWSLRRGHVIAHAIAEELHVRKARLLLLLSDVDKIWLQNCLRAASPSGADDMEFVASALAKDATWPLAELCTVVATSSCFTPPEHLRVACQDVLFVGGGRPDDIHMAKQVCARLGVPDMLAAPLLAKSGGCTKNFLALARQLQKNGLRMDVLLESGEVAAGHGGVLMDALRLQNASCIVGPERRWTGAVHPVQASDIDDQNILWKCNYPDVVVGEYRGLGFPTVGKDLYLFPPSVHALL